MAKIIKSFSGSHVVGVIADPKEPQFYPVWMLERVEAEFGRLESDEEIEAGIDLMDELQQEAIAAQEEAYFASYRYTAE